MTTDKATNGSKVKGMVQQAHTIRVGAFILITVLALLATAYFLRPLPYDPVKTPEELVHEVTGQLKNSYYDTMTDEDAYQSRFKPGKDLFDNMVLMTSFTDIGKNSPVVAGLLSKNHPCVSEQITSHGEGWMYFERESPIIVTGMKAETEAQYLQPITEVQPFPGPAANYVLCVDSNLDAGPNIPGQDVFVFNFNHYGTFQSATIQEESAFHWEEIIYSQEGKPLKEPFKAPTVAVGNIVGD